MPLRDRIRKFKSNAKSRVSRADRVDNGTHARAEQASAAPSPGSTHNWTHLQALLKTLEKATKPLAPLKAAMTAIAECIDIYEGISYEREEYETLHNELEVLFQALQPQCTESGPPIITTTVVGMCESIQNEIAEVHRKIAKGKRRAYLGAEQDARVVLTSYRRIQFYLQRISLNVDLSMWRIVDEATTDNRLKHLSPSLSARYNSAQAVELKRGPCTAGTRVDLLSQMLGWIDSSSSGSIYWISGMAGTGKTTIAYSLCLELEAKRRLAASFFCSRLLPECRDINLIIPSIAYQLARFSRPFRFVLSRTLEQDPDLHMQLPYIQFSSLILQPLLEVRDTLSDSLVVVIDALDECEKKETTRTILDLLITESSDLPVRFILSSRPEPEIRDGMARQNDQAGSRVVLHELDRQTVQADIETYLRAALAEMQPTEEQVTRLVERAGILFIYAATVVRYISQDRFQRNPRVRLANILESSNASENKHKEIDELYATILRAALDDPTLDRSEREDMRQVLHTVICAQEPLAMDTLSGLLQMNDTDRVRAALRPLWSVLHVSGASELVTTLHASFPDYMLNPSRSKQYYCDPELHNQNISQFCFDCFEAVRPQFNICGLESSHVPDNEVAGLEERVQAAISTHLFYAARYWGAHLCSGAGSPDVMQQLEEFISKRLLLWMEVMNLKKYTDAIPKVLRQVGGWRAERTADLDALIHDAWRFTSTFVLGAVSNSTPHIYISMLPFWPETSPVSRCYTKRVQGLIMAEGTAIGQKNYALLATWTFEDRTASHTFSPDGTQVALSVGINVVLLSSSTGRAILPPFEGHSWYVDSVQFSPDGTRIVSGSVGGIIYVWDARNGKTVLGPVTVESIPLHSPLRAAFSPDGACILTLSDLRVSLWDAFTGEHLVDLFKYSQADRFQPTRLIEWSPDGSYLVFFDREVLKICDPQDGRVLRILGSYDMTRSCSSIAISLDSVRIASSNRNTIYIWSSRTGEVVLGPLSTPDPGYFPSIVSISFSFDGTYLVYVSEDTIYLWDTLSGSLVSNPLGRHINCMSAIFSPDGIHIISNSYERTLCLWDTRSMDQTPGFLQRQMRSLPSAGFSPDGTRAISRFDDRTACVWDVNSGKIVLGPFELTEYQSPTAFSPDGRHIMLKSELGLVLRDTQTADVIHGPYRCFYLLWASFSPDSTRIITYEYVESRSHVPIPQPSNDIATAKHIARVLSVETGQTLMVIHLPYSEHSASATFSSDGARIVVRFVSRLYVYEAHSGRILYDNQYEYPVVGISPDFTRLVDSSMVVRGMQSGEEVILNGGHIWIYLAVFSLDGTRIAAVSDTNSICVWDAHTGQRLFGPVRAHINHVEFVQFSPDNSQIMSGARLDQGTRVTDIRPAKVPDSSLPSIGEWELRKDGWVVDESDRLLVWVPLDLCALLVWPRTKLWISPNGYLRLNFEGAYIGESWVKCYQSN